MSHISRLEGLALKPLSVLHLCAALFYLFNRAWWVAAWMILACLIIGAIGASLHPSKSASELAQGTLQRDWSSDGPILSHVETFAISKTMFTMAGVCGVTGLVTGAHYGYTWLAFIGIGFAAWAATILICVLVVAVAGHLRKSDLKQNQMTPHSKPKILLSVSQQAEGLATGLVELLQHWGYSPTAASSIDEAMEQLRTVNYDLAIFDLCDSAVEIVPNDLRELHPKILFLTCGHETHNLLLPTGHRDVIEKPIAPLVLMRKLGEMLR